METNQTPELQQQAQPPTELEKIAELKAREKEKEIERDAKMRLSIRRIMGKSAAEIPSDTRDMTPVCRWCRQQLDLVDKEWLHPEPFEKCPGPPPAEDFKVPTLDALQHPRVKQMIEQRKIERPRRAAPFGEREDE